MALAPHHTAVQHHRIPAADLDAIADGRPTPAVLGRLAAAERSRRLLLLRAVAEAEQHRADPGTGPLPPIADALTVLGGVEHRCPEVVDALLTHPGTGLWAVQVLSRLRADPAAAPAGGPPLWHELGYAHCLAAAALLGARVPGTVRLPAGPHGVCLPTLGTVELPSAPDCAVLQVAEDGRATVTLGPNRVALPTDLRRAVPFWRPSPVLSWRPTAAEHRIVLEDADPYCDIRPTASGAPLSTAELGRWQRLTDETGRILAARHPESGELVALTLRTVVPLPATSAFRTASASYSDAFGHTLVSRPQSAADLATTLIHEARHSLLNGIVHQVRFFDQVRSPLLYAPWRSDPRPAPGLLHGAYAFAGVTEFWRRERHALSGPEAELAHFEFAVWRQAVVSTLGTLRTGGELSRWGRRFVARIAERAAGWADDEVPDRLRALAEDEAADRWALWRIRHLRPEKGVTAKLSDRWLNGARAGAAPYPSRLRGVIRTAPSTPRAELRRRHLLRMRLDESVDPADLLLVRGEARRAADGYLATLARDPGSRSAWVGLGLALHLDGAPTAQAASRALLHRPELVRAVHLCTRARSASAPDPVELAAWMGADLRPALERAGAGGGMSGVRM